MSEILLARDRDQLDRLALALHDDRPVFALIVGSEELIPEATAYLRSNKQQTLPEPQRLTTGEDVLAFVSAGPARLRSGIVSSEQTEVLTALNWQREKLRSGNKYLVWLHGPDPMIAFKEHAPDAYTFRDLAITLTGHTRWPVGAPPAKSSELLAAEEQYAAARNPIERGIAAVGLGAKLYQSGQFNRTKRLMQAALRDIPATRSNISTRNLRAALMFELFRMMISSHELAEARKVRLTALRELSGLTIDDSRTEQYNFLLHTDTPAGPERRTLFGLWRDREESRSRPFAFAELHRQMARDLQVRGLFREALSLLARSLDITGLDAFFQANACRDQALLLLRMGCWDEFFETSRKAISLLQSISATDSVLAILLIDGYLAKGELSEAAALIGQFGDFDDDCDVALVRDARAEAMLVSGKTAGALQAVRESIESAISQQRDGQLFLEAQLFTSHVGAACDAGQLDQQTLLSALATLERAERIASKIAGKTNVWYPILFAQIRAELLVRIPERLQEAIALLTRAAEFSDRRWKEQSPGTLRRLGRVFLLGRDWAPARERLVSAAREAAAQEDLREQIEIIALLGLVGWMEGTETDTQGLLNELDKLFRRMDAPRVEIGILRSIAQDALTLRCPVDVRPLVDRALRRAVEIQMPGEQAHCLDILGDLSRFLADEELAQRRYTAAKVIVDKYGLGLRRRSLETKLPVDEQISGSNRRQGPPTTA
jgi:tetratricopeptide (TPR) repeat protein